MKRAIKQRAFTLVELSVVVAVLVIFAALVVPSFGRVRETQKLRDFYPNLKRVASYAREQAIAQQVVTVLSFDSVSQTFTVQADDTTDQNAPQGPQGQGQRAPGSSSAPMAVKKGNQATSNAPTASTPTVQEGIAAPPTITVGNFQLNGKDVDPSAWQIRFYPTGLSDSGAVDLHSGVSEQSLLINNRGLAKFQDGAPPDPTTIQWEAGQLEQRQ